MARPAARPAMKNSSNGANLGFETQLWRAADAQRSNMDGHEYCADNIFWAAKEVHWSVLVAAARQPTIAKTVQEVMLASARDNPSLKGVLPKDYAHLRLDKPRLGQLVELIGSIGVGDRGNRPKQSRTSSIPREKLLPKRLIGEVRIPGASCTEEVHQ